MAEKERPAPFFVADDPALDFLNSVAAPWGAEIEWLSNGSDLLEWLEFAKMVPDNVLSTFRKKKHEQECDQIAEKARELRAWFRGFVTAHAGRPLEAPVTKELDKINKLLAQDSCYHKIEIAKYSAPPAETSENVLHWNQLRHWQTPDSLLLPLVEAIGGLICRADFEKIKSCNGPPCTIWFLDITKNHKRRWCSMQICGNRAKAAAHRERNRIANEEPESQH